MNTRQVSLIGFVGLLLWVLMPLPREIATLMEAQWIEREEAKYNLVVLEHGPPVYPEADPSHIYFTIDRSAVDVIIEGNAFKELQ